MVLDFMYLRNFYYRMINGVKVLLFFLWTMIYQGILMIMERHKICLSLLRYNETSSFLNDNGL